MLRGRPFLEKVAGKFSVGLAVGTKKPSLKK
jgi:hypothetical protein